MSDHFDRLENRTAAARESILFRDLRHVLLIAKARVPSLRAQLRGVDISTLLTRADLERIPVRRRADLLDLQTELPPFGGRTATRLGGLKQTFLGRHGLVSVEGRARDWWGMGRALFAAGLRKGSLVLNCFPYELVADGHMIASGAEAIGAPVIPAGAAPVGRKVDVVAAMRPSFFCGTSDEFKALLDHAEDRGVDTTCIANALVTGPTGKGLRNEFSLRGFKVHHVFMIPEVGVVAFESGATDGMTINESILVEVLEPGTGRAVPDGQPGEIVVTRINADCPVLRYATGMLASISGVVSTCGRTNMRISGPLPHMPDFIEMCGRRIHIADILEIAKRTPGAGRISLVTRRSRGTDEAHLRVEHQGGIAFLEHLAETFHQITRLRGTIEVVVPGTLSDEDATIVDERPLN